jgi:ATP-dependent protease ClpP protease subunit
MSMIMQSMNPLMLEMKMNSALRDRRIYVEGIIDEDTAFEVCYFLNRLRDIDKKSNSEKKEITLLINCAGGSIIHGNKILGLLENMKSEGYYFISITTGMSFSMAFDLAIACNKRMAYIYAQFLLHQTQTGMEYGELKEVEMDVEFQKKIWNISVDYYIKYTKIPKEKIDEIYNYKINMFLTATEALDLGIIDEII